MEKRLYRSRDERMLGGVAGGLADYFEQDPTIVRIIIVLLTLVTSGTGALLYVAMWVLLPVGPASADGVLGASMLDGWTASEGTAGGPAGAGTPPTATGGEAAPAGPAGEAAAATVAMAVEQPSSERDESAPTRDADSAPSTEGAQEQPAYEQPTQEQPAYEEPVTAPPHAYEPPAYASQPHHEAPWQQWQQEEPRGWGPGPWFGLALIAFGALLIVERYVFDVSLWELWPVIIIVIGLVSGVRRLRAADIDGAVGALTTIAIGGILLANTSGYLPWSSWFNVLSLWPAFIIAFGLGVLGWSLQQDAIRVLGSLLILGIIVYGAAFMGSSGTPWFPLFTVASGETEELDFEAPHDDDITEGFIDIEAGAGSITLAEGEELVAATGETTFDDPEFEVDEGDGDAEVFISTGKGHGVGGAELDVLLDEDVIWDIELDAGAASVDADLSALEVVALTVNAGVTDVDVTFGDLARDATADIDTGVSSVTLRVPEGIGVEVRVRSALTGVSVPAGFARDEGESDRVWRTDDYDRAFRTLAITVDAGVSDVDLVTYE